MHRPSQKILAIAIVLAAVTAGSAESSKLVMSWKNPSYAAGKKFQRVLALGLSDKTRIRADFEDALAAQLAETGVEAIPGNTILLRPKGTELDLNYLKIQIRDNKIDAVVVSRLVKVETNVTTCRALPTSCPFRTTRLCTATTARSIQPSTRQII